MAISQVGVNGIAASGLSASALTTGRLPVAQMPAGSVIQVVQTNNGTEQYTTSGTQVATSIAATITPLYATSKILVIASVAYYLDGNSATQGAFQVYRNNTTLLFQFNDAVQLNTGATITRFAMPQACATYYDSPATTSATTYTVYIWRRGGTGTVGVNSYGSSPQPASGFTLMEIAQ
jgi:hypothetical protein